MKLWSDSWTNGERDPRALRRRPPRHARRRDLRRQPQPAPGVERPARRHALARPHLPRLRRAEQGRRRQPGRPRGAGRPAAGRLLPLARWSTCRPTASADRRGRLQPAASRRAASPGRRSPCRASTARARASTTTPAGSPATPTMAGDYYGYDGPFPPWNDSLVHHYVFTLLRARRRAGADRGPVRRRRAAPGDPRRTCSARRPTPAPTR